MDKCWLKGSEGEALHAVLCAAGFNIRWLMRALWRQVQASGLKHVFYALIALCATWLVAGMARPGASASTNKRRGLVAA